jgi:hypothetical protein
VGELYEHFLRVGDELGVVTRPAFVSGETVAMIGDPLPHEAYEWRALFDALEEATRAPVQPLPPLAPVPAPPRALAPLPVFGYPGWADNDRAEFYDDERYFRQGKAG